MGLYDSDDSLLLASFKEWFDHVLLDEGGAYLNRTARLFHDSSKRLGNSYTTYTSPYQQWVYDSSITGANIPTGITGDPDHPVINRGDSGMRFDFVNGGVILGDDRREDLYVFSSFATKDINSYITTRPDEKIVFETKFDFAPEMREATTGTPMDTVVAPAAFIKSVQSEEQGFCLGGTNKNYHNIRVLVVSNSELQLVGLGSIFKKKKNKCIKILAGSQLPLDEFGDLKSGFSGSWNYNSQAAVAPQSAYIDEVMFYPENGAELTRSPHSLVGILEFRLFTVR